MIRFSLIELFLAFFVYELLLRDIMLSLLKLL